MRDLRRFALLLVMPLLLLGGLYAWVVLRSPAPDAAPLVRTADRRVAWVGDSVTVRLHVNGDRFVSASAPAPAGRPHVSVLLIDHSSSMGAGPGSALESARSAAGYFARVVAGERQPVGVVAFDDVALVAAEPGPDGAALEHSILAIAPGNGTDIAAALREGTGVLARALAT
ncbi:MAG TPA: VWA domain-containing protein, partial [Longimicrobium sp.]